MKKTFTLVLAILFTIISFGNSIEIYNFTGATVYYSLRGEDNSTIFESQEFEIGPGEILSYDHPSLVPGLEYLSSSAVFIYIKGYSPDCNSDLSVGCDGNSYFVNTMGPNPNNCMPIINGIELDGDCDDNIVVKIY